MRGHRLVAALVFAMLVPAVSTARPAAEMAARVDSGITRLTCGSSSGGISSNACSINPLPDLPFGLPFGPPPTAADLAAAKQVMRIDHIQVTTRNDNSCSFSLGLADPGGAPGGFFGLRIGATPQPGVGTYGESSPRVHVRGIDMEYTSMFCQNPIQNGEIQIYYTLLPRGR